MAAIASLIIRIPNYIHWFTGQIWVTKTGFSKKIYKFIDKIIFTLSDRVLVDSFSQRRFLIRENIITRQKSSVLFRGSVGGVDIVKFKFNKNKGKELREKYSIKKNTFEIRKIVYEKFLFKFFCLKLEINKSLSNLLFEYESLPFFKLFSYIIFFFPKLYLPAP